MFEKDAKEILLESNRFDLIFKYIYLLNKHKQTDFYRQFYLSHIKAFNNFHEEEPSDGIPKDGPDNFLKQFDRVYESIAKNGFDKSKGCIPIGNNGEISDGAHRLVASAVLGLKVPLENDGRHDCYDYSFFLERGLERKYADYAALEYVRLHPRSYIVCLHSAIPEEKDSLVETILKKYGRIFYKKNISLNFNAYVNLKKINYGSFWERESWIGNVDNNFAGAQDHARKSMGNGKFLRAYVFVCDDADNLPVIKKTVRDMFGIGNYSIHINDHREEAVALAELFFNDNSLEILNYRDFNFEDYEFDARLQKFSDKILERKFDINDFCIGGSAPLNICGLRKSDDIDFLFSGSKKECSCIEDDVISNHESELAYYPDNKINIIYDPSFYFYYKSFKIISVDTLINMKSNRSEKPKDINDIKLLKKIKKNSKIRKSLVHSFFLFLEKIWIAN